jgi:hypothetical protein
MPRPRDVIDVLDPVVDRGHLQFTTFNLAEASYFDQIGVSGAIAPMAGDYVSVVTSNAGASKIDLFLQRHLQYHVNWDPDTGAVSAKLTATLQNTAPASGPPDYVIGNTVGLPQGTNRSFVSIYSAYRLDGAKLNGQPVTLQSEVELARAVYSTFVEIPPGGTVTLELDLSGQLPGGLAGLGFYPLRMQPQPLAQPEQAELTINVAGRDELHVKGDGVEVHERAVTWSGTFDTFHQIGITAGEVEGDLSALAPGGG